MNGKGICIKRNYYGVQISETELPKNWLPKGKIIFHQWSWRDLKQDGAKLPCKSWQSSQQKPLLRKKNQYSMGGKTVQIQSESTIKLKTLRNKNMKKPHHQ